MTPHETCGSGSASSRSLVSPPARSSAARARPRRRPGRIPHCASAKRRSGPPTRPSRWPSSRSASWPAPPPSSRPRATSPSTSSRCRPLAAAAKTSSTRPPSSTGPRRRTGRLRTRTRLPDHRTRAPAATRARRRPAVYYPLTYSPPSAKAADAGRSASTSAPTPSRAPYLKRARDDGRPTATPVIQLLLGGTGINVYRAVYRDGAPTATVAERRRGPDRLRRRQLPRQRPRRGGDRRAARRRRLQLRVAGNTGGRAARRARRPGRAPGSRSPTAPGCWSSATPTGPTSACRCCSAAIGDRPGGRCSAR